jgi:hypothetical protein
MERMLHAFEWIVEAATFAATISQLRLWELELPLLPDSPDS